MDLGENISRLILLAQKFAEATPDFFATKGPGAGDRATNEFMQKLNSNATSIFGKVYTAPKICGETNFAPDFYFPEEQTVVEFAFSLDKPISEYERDIFKCLLAKDNGFPVRSLLLVCKPGGQRRLSAPGPKAISDWAARHCALDVLVWDLIAPG